MPAMPPGCEIAAAPDAQGVTLSWPAYKGPEPGRYATGGFLLFWLSFWTLFGVTAIFQFVTGRGSPFLAFWLCGWAAGEAVVGWKLWDMFRPIRPEWVRLGTDRLEYDPGRGCWRCCGGGSGRPARRRGGLRRGNPGRARDRTASGYWCSAGGPPALRPEAAA